MAKKPPFPMKAPKAGSMAMPAAPFGKSSTGSKALPFGKAPKKKR